MDIFTQFFNGNLLGVGLLNPLKEYKFASKNMTPRFDENGNIYMLVCETTQEPKETANTKG